MLRKSKTKFKIDREEYIIPRSSESDVMVLKEVSEIESDLEMLSGIFTIKVTDHDNPGNFWLNENNTIAGYVHADGKARVLDLTTGKPKLFIKVTASYYHFLIDHVGDILQAVEEFPDHELIVDMSGVVPMLNEDNPGLTFFYEFLLMLKFHGIDHKVVNLTDYDVVYIDDFYTVEYTLQSSIRADRVYEYFLPYVQDKDAKPFRHVYVSRRLQDSTRPHQTSVEKTGYQYDGLRIDDEYALEQLFLGLGFEIIFPENFKNFDEQVNFFHSVKTIASLTSSGLTNAVFMQPGGTVIEIASPIVARPTVSNGSAVGTLQKSMHNFYKDLSFLKMHNYVSIQNPDCKFEDVRNAIESNSKLKQFIDARND